MTRIDPDSPRASEVFVPGTRVGGHEIVALIGSGGAGKVFRARDPQLERFVALGRRYPSLVVMVKRPGVP